MKLFSVLALALLASLPVVAQAGELDNEDQVKNAQRFAADLPQTLVVRVDAAGKVAVLHSNEKLNAGATVDESKFVEMNATDTMRSELDKDSSSSGWYFYWNYYNYYYPTYYYYGYNYYYQPYYSYYYNNCQYYWYRWYW